MGLPNCLLRSDIFTKILHPLPIPMPCPVRCLGRVTEFTQVRCPLAYFVTCYFFFILMGLLPTLNPYPGGTPLADSLLLQLTSIPAGRLFHYKCEDALCSGGGRRGGTLTWTKLVFKL